MSLFHALLCPAWRALVALAQHCRHTHWVRSYPGHCAEPASLQVTDNQSRRAFHPSASSSSSLSGAARGSAITAATSRSVICAAVRAWYSRCQPDTRPPPSAATSGAGAGVRFCARGSRVQQQGPAPSRARVHEECCTHTCVPLA